MAYDIDNKLVIAIASSALFDLKESDEIFKTEGLEKYKEYQEEGSTQILAQKYNVDITTIERNLSKIDKNYYKNYGWRFKLPRKQSLQMCEDFK